jgi:predicted TIM-barrel fold metal-dependent hydrolase
LIAGNSNRTPVIDAHTHIFPREIVDDRASFVARELWFEQLYTNQKALLVGADELLSSMDAAGVFHSVVCGFPWRDDSLCRLHNDFMAEACSKANGRLSWLCIVPPGSGSRAAEEADRCFELGAVGVGELNADAQEFDLADTRVITELFELCAIRERPIMLHASEPVGHLYPGKGKATPDRLVSMIETFPEATFVLAHWGGGLPFYELMPEINAITSRLYYDTAASTYLYRWQIFRSVLDIVGPERVMFATDYPVLRQDRFIERAMEVAWNDEAEQRAVLCENARRVYKLSV